MPRRSAHYEAVAAAIGAREIELRWSRFGLVAAAAGTFVLASDELLKAFVRATLPACNGPHLADCAGLDVFGPLRLVRTENAGSALGFAQGWAIWMLLAAVGLLLIPLYARQLRAVGAVGALAAGLQGGGALGNLVDRLALGGATDMLTLGPALVWNVADVALAVGTLLATALLVNALER